MSIKVVEAPHELYSVDNNTKSTKLFLAGGITNCPVWQTEVIKLLRDLKLKNLTIYNPRREDYPNDPEAIEEQIVWEHNHLRDADIIAFWFSKGSLNPITLFEYGKWGFNPNKKIVLGIDPDYERNLDVRIQTTLEIRNKIISPTLEMLADQIKVQIIMLR